MLLKEFRNHFNKELSNLFPQTEIDSFFFMLTEKELNLQRIDVVINNELSISKEKFEHFYNTLSRLKAQEPIQYILGETEFYGLPFKVTKDVLIPRPETEELVDWILTDNNKNDKISILDIGTGSGCIPISLAKKLPNASVTSIDISKAAIAIAKENATLNNVTINFIEQDILNTFKLTQQYDIIVSNPPYVRELEKKEILPNVLENEPHLALFVDDDTPLIFYSKIADLAKNHLKKDGILYFESVIKETGRVMPHDLLVFCKVVSCQYPNTPDLKPRLRDVFRYILTNRKKPFKRNTEMLRSWMDVQTCSPILWDVKQAEGASTREVKSPAMLALVMNLISKAGTTLKETWNMRLSEARWCDLTLSELNGNPIRFAYENEDQPAATLPELSEKEIIAEAKKTLSKSSFEGWLRARKQNNIKN